MKNIQFQDGPIPVVFPVEHAQLAEAIAKLNLENGRPVIVLIGGEIDEKQADVTHRAIHSISEAAENMNALVICGGTDMGVMAEIGSVRSENHHKFPLVGIAPEELVSWPDGPHSTKFLLWGTKRWPLASHYSHFILVPGHEFGDESSWILDAATILAAGHPSVTILINGGEVSRKDIELSLEIGRPVIVLSRTGRLADQISREPHRNKLITVLPANAESRIIESIREAMSIHAA